MFKKILTEDAPINTVNLYVHVHTYICWTLVHTHVYTHLCLVLSRGPTAIKKPRDFCARAHLTNDLPLPEVTEQPPRKALKFR